MRVMVIVKGDRECEAGAMPKTEFLAAMGKFNDELVKAGVMLAVDGLQPSEKGVRVKFAGGKRTVIDGPFTESKELVAGYWLWQVKSLQEAVEWIKRSPFEETEVEIRPIIDRDEFLAKFKPEQRNEKQPLHKEIRMKSASV